MIFSDAFIAAVNDSGPGPVAFAMMRDERLRLPSWLSHHRAMGIRRFVVIDNGSRDGTWEMLAAEPDVHAVRTDESYLQSGWGAAWLAEFHAKIAPGTWVLFTDADELLVYRGWPARPLDDLLAAAGEHGANALFAFMLDMYPDGPLEAARPGADAGMMALAPCFDGDYVFRRPPVRPWQDAPAGAIEVLGGPRLRLLSTLDRERRTTWLHYFARGQIDRLLPLTPDALLPLLVRAMPKQMPALSKFPLVRAGEDIRYLNAHSCTGVRPYGENAVLLHYKFLGDFADRVAVECTRREHYRRGSEYLMYARLLRKHGHLDLRYGGTRRFSGADQLVELSLIRDIGPLLAADRRSGADDESAKGAAETCGSSDGQAPSAGPLRAA